MKVSLADGMSLIYCGIKALSTRNPVRCSLFSGLPVRRVRPENISREPSETRNIDDDEVIGKIKGRSSPTESARQKPENGNAVEGPLSRQGGERQGSRKKGSRQQEGPEGRAAHPAEDAVRQALVGDQHAATTQPLRHQRKHRSQSEGGVPRAPAPLDVLPGG